MSRRLIPLGEMGARAPLLALSMACVVLALILYATDHGVAAFTALIGAFLLVAAAKRA